MAHMKSMYEEERRQADARRNGNAQTATTGDGLVNLAGMLFAGITWIAMGSFAFALSHQSAFLLFTIPGILSIAAGIRFLSQN